MPKNEDPTWDFGVTVGVSLIKKINIEKLDEIIFDPDPERLVDMKLGLRAFMEGQFLRFLGEGKGPLIQAFHEQFERSWDEMVDRSVGLTKTEDDKCQDVPTVTNLLH